MTWAKRLRAGSVISSIWAATWGGFALLREISNLVPGLRHPGLPRWDVPLWQNLEVIVPNVAVYAAVGAGIGAVYAGAIYLAGRRRTMHELSLRLASSAGAAAGAAPMLVWLTLHVAAGGAAPTDSGTELLLNGALGFAAGSLTLWFARRGVTRPLEEPGRMGAARWPERAVAGFVSAEPPVFRTGEGVNRPETVGGFPSSRR